MLYIIHEIDAYKQTVPISHTHKSLHQMLITVSTNSQCINVSSQKIRLKQEKYCIPSITDLACLHKWKGIEFGWFPVLAAREVLFFFFN